MPTPSPQRQTRINLADLKLQIVKKLGPGRSQQYFCNLNLLLDQKLSKAEFNRCCLLILGRENIPLHNQLVRSILKNALHAKIPPPLHVKAASLPAVTTVEIPTQGDSISNSLGTAVPTDRPWSNGDILPASPRKLRSGTRDRRVKDRPSPLGLNGRADVTSHHSLVPLDSNVVAENCILCPCDLKRPRQNHQADPSEHHQKRSRTQSLVSHDQDSFVQDAEEVPVIHGGEEVHQGNYLNSNRGPLQAPLGIPFCHASVGGAQKSFSIINSSCGDTCSSHDGGELCSTETLKNRLEKIAEAHGLGGVTMECSDLLNNGLDAYLRRVIASCADIVRARQGHHQVKQPVANHQYMSKPVNGIWPANHMRAQSSSGSLDQMQGQRKQCSISMQDFRVALELNPQQLGEDCSLLLEKVCLRLSHD